MDRYFRNDVLDKINELVEVNKSVSNLYAQIDRHNMALKQISDLIKDIKKERRPIQQVIAGNMVVPMSQKQAIKILQQRRSEIEMGAKTMEGQVKQRADTLKSCIVKVYRLMRLEIDPDILADLDKSKGLFEEPIKVEEKDGKKP